MTLHLCIVPLYIVVFLILGAAITAGIFIIHVVVVPLIFKYLKSFQRGLIFCNFVQWPPRVDHDDPSASGVDGASNLNIEFHSKVDNCPIKIGVWHVLPKSVYSRLKPQIEEKKKRSDTDKEQLRAIFDAELVNSSTPIMLYCHGNSNSRAATHRVHLYRFFQQMEYHTIALDYRGYGDSTPVSPSEDGVVEDALVVYDWLLTTVAKGANPPPVFVWGHSLGTGIAAHALSNLEVLSKTLLARAQPLPSPSGLILDSPFTNLSDEVENIPIAKLIDWLPYFRAWCVRPFNCKTHAFRTSSHLARAKDLPILILHARDDLIVPHVLGEKLYKYILESRCNGGASLIFHSFDSCERLGHRYICHAMGLDKVISDFVLAHQ